MDLKIFLASWSLRSDMVGRSARKMALAYGISCAQRTVNDTDGPLLNGFDLVRLLLCNQMVPDRGSIFKNRSYNCQVKMS